MAKIAYLLMLMIGLVSCKIKTNNIVDGVKENTTVQDTSYYTILHYGYPNTSRLVLMEMVSEKWKIKHVEATGCVTDVQSMNAIDRKNKKTYAAIEKRYGKDWKIKYEKDLEDAAMKQADIMDVLIVNRPFRDQIKKCNIEIDGVDKDVTQLGNSETYEVIVYGYDQNNKRINCCTLHIDTKNRKVNLIK
ncbi:hypothetical protein [Chryseobacterium arthrosphaerae]|uniref:FEKKY domain-containing protein n=1 Tax=Chryseobacterium arthrosphaerae TaxID=651561 RepID=UPI001F4BBF32|nr:hypothetical protein [Chryseobacterium arthrosphaerae]MDG4652437.1 hypothetical protein [Chryseobacterium arthrosphaerae]